MPPEHTPAPWQLGHSTLHGSNGEPIMTAMAFLHAAPADRALIIAAPDLLAVCERIMAKDGVAGLRGELEAAVAKARGET